MVFFFFTCGFLTGFCGLGAFCFTWTSAIKCTLIHQIHETGCKTRKKFSCQEINKDGCTDWLPIKKENSVMLMIEPVGTSSYFWTPPKAALISAQSTNLLKNITLLCSINQHWHCFTKSRLKRRVACEDPVRNPETRRGSAKELHRCLCSGQKAIACSHRYYNSCQWSRKKNEQIN